MARRLRDGFDLGVRDPRTQERATLNSDVRDEHEGKLLDEHFAKELRAGRYADVTDVPAIRAGMFSARMVLVKQTDKTRVCHDLSHGECALNQDIWEEDRKVIYQGRQTAARIISDMVAVFGSTAVRLSKFDVQGAFRLVPVQPRDWKLQGSSYRGRVYVDKHLSFGGASAPRIFDELGTVLMDIARTTIEAQVDTQEFGIVRYCDDMLLVTRDAVTQKVVREFTRCMDSLGAPLKQEKQVVDVRCIDFLGIHIDLEGNRMRVTEERRVRVMAELEELEASATVSVEQARRLLGKLVWASQTMTDVSALISVLFGLVRAQKGGRVRALAPRHRKAARVWRTALTRNDGVPIWIMNAGHQRERVDFWTDASGRGLGAVYPQAPGGPQYTQARLPDELRRSKPKRREGERQVSIAFLEMSGVYLAVLTWPEAVAGKHVVVHCDNKTVVANVNSMRARTDDLAAMLMELTHVLAKADATMRLEHVPGADNEQADAASRHKPMPAEFTRVAPPREIFDVMRDTADMSHSRRTPRKNEKDGHGGRHEVDEDAPEAGGERAHQAQQEASSQRVHAVPQVSRKRSDSQDGAGPPRRRIRRNRTEDGQRGTGHRDATCVRPIHLLPAAGVGQPVLECRRQQAIGAAEGRTRHGHYDDPEVQAVDQGTRETPPRPADPWGYQASGPERGVYRGAAGHVRQRKKTAGPARAAHDGRRRGQAGQGRLPAVYQNGEGQAREIHRDRPPEGRQRHVQASDVVCATDTAGGGRRRD